MVPEVCHDWCSPTFSLHNVYHSWLWLNYFPGLALASSSASMFFALSMCLTVNPLKKFSILQTTARYLSRVSSLAMHSFSIWLAITLESIFRVQHWTPIAHNLRRPSNTAAYLAMLLLHLSISTTNCNHVAYLNFMPKGDLSIIAAPAPKISQTPSQYTYHGASMNVLQYSLTAPSSPQGNLPRLVTLWHFSSQNLIHAPIVPRPIFLFFPRNHNFQKYRSVAGSSGPWLCGLWNNVKASFLLRPQLNISFPPLSNTSLSRTELQKQNILGLVAITFCPPSISLFLVRGFHSQ
jgi:hypothetical protein